MKSVQATENYSPERQKFIAAITECAACLSQAESNRASAHQRNRAGFLAFLVVGVNNVD